MKPKINWRNFGIQERDVVNEVEIMTDVGDEQDKINISINNISNSSDKTIEVESYVT